MPPECTNNWIIPLITSGVTTAIAGMIGYLSARFTNDRNVRNTACATFRAAFAPALGQIFLAQHHGDHDRPDIDSFVKDNLLAHASAVEIFRPHVSNKNSAAYQEAWENYRKIANDSIESSVEDRMAALQPGSVLEHNINRILSFAK